MKIVKFLAPIVALTIFGCGGKSDNTPVAPVLNAITDMTSCHGDAPSGATIFGKWIAQAQKNQLVVVTNLIIETTDIKSSIVCQTATGPVDPSNPINAKTQTITTNLSAPSTVSGSQLILTKSSPSGPPDPNASTQDPACSKSLDPGTYNFRLVGNCLLLSTDTQNFFFLKQ